MTNHPTVDDIQARIQRLRELVDQTELFAALGPYVEVRRKIITADVAALLDALDALVEGVRLAREDIRDMLAADRRHYDTYGQPGMFGRICALTDALTILNGHTAVHAALVERARDEWEVDPAPVCVAPQLGAAIMARFDADEARSIRAAAKAQGVTQAVFVRTAALAAAAPPPVGQTGAPDAQ